MFQENKEGQTHSFNDGCGEPEHNDVSLWKDKFKQEFGIHFSPSELQFAIAFIEDLLSSERQRLKEELRGIISNCSDCKAQGVTEMVETHLKLLDTKE